MERDTMIHHDLIMIGGEYPWQQFRCWYPRFIKSSRLDQAGTPLVFETFVWFERIERRLNKQWLTSDTVDVYEYRLVRW
jgi:hypothetical protein